MDNDKLNIIIKEMISHLNDGNWHTLYSLHEHFRLSPVEVLNGIDFLESLNILKKENNNIKLIKENINNEILKKLSVEYRKKFSINEKDIKSALSSSNVEKIGINELYIPEIKILDKSLKIVRSNKEA